MKRRKIKLNRKALTHNLGLKILAVLFSVMLWIVATNINDPVQRRTYYRVPVTMTNTSAVTGSGKTYRVLDDTDEVTITVRATETMLDSIDREDLVAVADFSQMTEDNTVPITVSLSRYSKGDVEEISTNIDSVRLEVEDRIEKQLEIQLKTIGTAAEGYMAGTPVTDINAMTISGPESVVNQVDRAVAEISLNNVRTTLHITAAIRLLDEEGNEVTSSEIEKSATEVSVDVPVYEVKEVPIVYEHMGEPADGYQISGSRTITPETVRVAGRSSVIDALENITIPAEALDITGATRTQEITVNIREYLPADVYLADSTFDGNVTVTIPIQAVRYRDITLRSENIQLQNIPAGYEAVLAEGQDLTVTVYGLQEDVNQVNADTVLGLINVSNLFGAEGVTEGTISAQAALTLPSGVRVSSPLTVNVTISRIMAETAMDIQQ